MIIFIPTPFSENPTRNDFYRFGDDKTTFQLGDDWEDGEWLEKQHDAYCTHWWKPIEVNESDFNEFFKQQLK